MHYFYSLISFSILFRNILFLVSILEMKNLLTLRGRSGGAMVLGKRSVPGRPTNLDKCSTRLTALAVGAGGKCLGIFFLSSIFPLFFLPLWETVRCRLKYGLKGPLSPKQPTNELSMNSCTRYLYGLSFSTLSCKVKQQCTQKEITSQTD